MTKINRRDYLKRLGVAAAGTLGAAELNLLGTEGVAFPSNPANQFGVIESLRDPENATTPQSCAIGWPCTADPPKSANPGIRLIFMGMAVFGYDGNEGHVGFHRGSQHDLRIFVFEKCKEIYRFGAGTSHLKTMEIRIEHTPSKKEFFTKNGFDRTKDILCDPNDFRWLLDLEASPVHTGPLGRKEGMFSTKLKVHHGKFYTYQRTYATFHAKPTCPPPACKCGETSRTCNCKYIGHVANVMAADITPAPGKTVLFTLEFDGSSKIVLPPLSPDTNIGLTYEIYFLNGYQTTGTAGDFYMVFDAVNATPSQTFDLELRDKGQDKFPSGLCVKEPPIKYRKKNRKSHEKRAIPSADEPSISELIEIMLNDEAPCMGAGLGTGGGVL